VSPMHERITERAIKGLWEGDGSGFLSTDGRQCHHLTKRGKNRCGAIAPQTEGARRKGPERGGGCQRKSSKTQDRREGLDKKKIL